MGRARSKLSNSHIDADRFLLQISQDASFAEFTTMPRVLKASERNAGARQSYTIDSYSTSSDL